MKPFNSPEYILPDVRLYGGFVSQLPSSLEGPRQHLLEIQRNGSPYETAVARKEVLLQTLVQVQADPECTPETCAALQGALAVAYQQLPGGDRTRQMEAALVACEAALQVYTLARYAFQYASVQVTLGNVYRERVVGTQRDNLEQAIACYREALHVFTLADFPYEYAQAHHGFGQTYQLRIEGERQDNLEQAFTCCHEALGVRTAGTFPFEHAATLHVLGTAFIRRVAGERRANLEQAIDCFRQAAAIFTVEAFPREYAEGQHGLATAYSQRIAGEQRDNLEQAITYYHRALRVYTLDALPLEYARVQNNLCLAYWQRSAGERRDNLERAIACGREGLRVYSLDRFPFQYAMLQNNLGAVYLIRVAGARRDNLEQTIACYREAMRAWTLEAFPYQYAKVQNNLGEAYQHRLAGERRDNLEQAVDCYREAMRVWTLDGLPQDYAMAQRNLAVTYQVRLAGERQHNLTLALAAHRASLAVYTLDAFPREHRQVQLDCAETQALREDWEGAHDAYVAARKAEALLVALGAGAIGRDAVLKEGREAAIHDGFALARLGKIAEAAVAIERGRASGLAESVQFTAADPLRISNAERRMRYTTAHRTFLVAQAHLHAPTSTDLDEDSQRHVMLERTAAYREARAAFDAVVQEIRVARDPADFLHDTLDAVTILHAAQRCGPGHALVYLAATPWGGVAVAACSSRPGTSLSAQFAALALPALTEDFVRALIETHLADSEHITGGFDCAQRGNVFALLQAWPGTTFRERADALHAACVMNAHPGTIDAAAQDVLALLELAPLLDQALTTVSEESSSLLASTLNHAVLQRELQRCQSVLRETLLQPVFSWLHEAGVGSLTLVPCGRLAAFPLEGTLLDDGRTLGETLPTSIAPSALSLLHDEHTSAPRTGIYALGNPYPTQQNLRWGEAEAFTLAELGTRLELFASVKVQWQASRDWLIEALHTGLVVNASCHGIFDTQNFLRSRLFLAHEEELTLADMLSDRVDLRGLRLLILSACQTAILDLQGARDEVRSLAAGMLQAGAAAILASLWSVDDRATYLLMVRFALEWFPQMHTEPPATALARAQRWLRTVTNHELRLWQATISSLSVEASNPAKEPETVTGARVLADTGHLVAVRGRANRFDAVQAQELVQFSAEELAPDDCPYADPYYWAGFQITGW
ncbi:MAG: CHAT domain-containing protein [Ktedonobacteraceae bacterium]|nr:CHAT domain-containing protein [Ktedonobacteraceae bacterium]